MLFYSILFYSQNHSSLHKSEGYFQSTLSLENEVRKVEHLIFKILENSPLLELHISEKLLIENTLSRRLLCVWLIELNPR